MCDFNPLINAIEEIYVTFKHYSRIVHPFRDNERLIPFIEEFYGLEYLYEKAYDTFMENPSMDAYVDVSLLEEEMMDYMDNTLQPKISEKLISISQHR
jgi:hypothetical protein